MLIAPSKKNGRHDTKRQRRERKPTSPPKWEMQPRSVVDRIRLIP